MFCFKPRAIPLLAAKGSRVLPAAADDARGAAWSVLRGSRAMLGHGRALQEQDTAAPGGGTHSGASIPAETELRGRRNNAGSFVCPQMQSHTWDISSAKNSKGRVEKKIKNKKNQNNQQEVPGVLGSRHHWGTGSSWFVSLCAFRLDPAGWKMAFHRCPQHLWVRRGFF